MSNSQLIIRASRGRVDYNFVNYCSTCNLKYPKSFYYCGECNRKLRFKPFNRLGKLNSREFEVAKRCSVVHAITTYSYSDLTAAITSPKVVLRLPVTKWPFAG